MFSRLVHSECGGLFKFSRSVWLAAPCWFPFCSTRFFSTTIERFCRKFWCEFLPDRFRLQNAASLSSTRAVSLPHPPLPASLQQLLLSKISVWVVRGRGQAEAPGRRSRSEVCVLECVSAAGSGRPVSQGGRGKGSAWSWKTMFPFPPGSLGSSVSFPLKTERKREPDGETRFRAAKLMNPHKC